MGFSEDYFELEKKRKKKKEEEKQNTTSTKKSFSEEYAELERKRTTAKGDDNDIAPLFVNKTAALFAPVAENKRSFGNDRTEGTFGGEEKERKWFEKGAFSDGYQFGDVTKTILGTRGDVRSNISKGILGIAEGAVDAGAYVAGLFGADEFKEKTKNFIKKDLIKEDAVDDLMLEGDLVSKLILGEKTIDESSVLGEKSDSLIQSGGQLAGTIGLQHVGVPWSVTTGVTSFGRGVDEAFKEDATYGEAGMSAAISAGAEILSEKLFGGSGLGEKGLINLEPLTKGISSKVVKALSDYGVDMAAEGAEEIVSQFMGNLGSALYKEENLSDILFSEEAIDGYIESAIGGAVLGGVANVGNVADSIQTGKDYRTGLTDNEQKVVDKVVADRIAEEEKNGKVTKKKQDEIYNQVVSEMEKGYLSTDTIEEVLGGDTFKSYRETVDSEDAMRSEFDTLNKMKQGEMTGEQIDRRAELKQQLEELKTTSQRNQLKSQLGEEVFGLVKGDRLSESYNERGRKSQVFEADLTKYDTKYHGTIQKAIDSGILNNTNRTHEFVDMIAKISADKGVLFDFTNNAKLKESGFAVDGKDVNGYVTKDGITLNIDSAKAWQSTVGHEITHVLEGTELYTELQTALNDYAKSKGEYDSRLAKLSEFYKGIEGADVNAELTADLVGEYLFTDTDFINTLSTTHRNVFQKIYDEIKYLYKVATAGSKEARELEKVKKAFDKAYKEGGKVSEGTKYSIGETTDGRFAAIVDNDILSNLDTSSWDDAKKDEAKKAASNALKKFSSGIVVDGITRKVNRTSRREYTRSNDTEQLYNQKTDVFADKMRAADVADDIVIAATDWNRDGGLKHPRKDNFVDFDHGRTLIVSGEAKYSAEVVVGITDTGDAVFYDVVDMTPTTFDIKKEESPTTATTQNAIGDIQGDSFAPNVAQVGGDVKYSLSDSDGKQLTKEQQDYFKDSKMRDENGNLKVMYHGSQDAGFHVFDARMSDDDTSFFFTDRNDVAASYSGTSETYEAKTIRTAEDMRNFLESIGYEGYEVIEEGGKIFIEQNGDYVAGGNTAQELYEEFCWYEGIGEGDANYKVYLNLTNPLIVDAKDRPWNRIPSEYSEELYNKYKSLTEEERTALVELADWEDWSVFKDEILAAKEDITLGAQNPLSTAIGKLMDKQGNLSISNLFSIASANFTEEAISENAFEYLNTRQYAQKAKEQGYDGVIFKNIVDNGGYSNGSEGASTVAIAFDSNQIKSVANDKPTADKDIRYSLSEKGEQFAPVGRNSVPARDLRLEVAPAPENTAPVQRVTVAENTTVSDMFPDDYAPVTEDDSERLDSLTDADVPPEVDRHNQEQTVTVDDPFEERDWFEVGKDRKAKAYMYENPEVKPFFQEEARILWGELDNTQKGERWFNSGDFGGYGAESYYRYGGTKRYTSQSMETLLDEWGMSYAQIEKGLKAIVEDNGAENIADAKHIEFMLNDRLLNGYKDFFTGDYIPPNQDYINLLNEKQINEYSKEAFDAFMARADEFAPVAAVEEESPAPVAPVEDIAPVREVTPSQPAAEETKQTEREEGTRGKTAQIVYGRTEQPKKQSAIKWAREHIFRRGAVFEDLALETGNRELQARFDNTRRAESAAQHFIANGDGEASSLKSVYDEVVQAGKLEAFNEYLYHMHNVDRMSLETPENKAKRESLAERFKGYTEKQIADTATDWITKDSPPEVVARIKAARAYLEALKGKNKPVWGEEVTADISRKTAGRMEAENPEFKQWAEELYGINKYLRQMLVADGEITQATADLWEKMYPHYVPIKRVDKDGNAITVPLDTGRTGVNAPIKRATGGNSDFYDAFGAMSDRIEQTYRAIARNRFGVELKNTLNTVIETEAEKHGILPEGTIVRAHDRDNIGTIRAYNEKTGKYTVHFENKKGYAANAQIDAKMVTPLKPVNTDSDMDSTLDGIDAELLQEGKNGQSPTFTVFENGKRVKFAITEDMYEAMKPSQYTYNNKVLNKISDFRRDTLTKYSPKFMITNPLKDIGDIVVNSQHPVRTYMAIPEAVKEIVTNGHWYQERMKHGGGQDTYFDNKTLSFKEKGKFAKTVGFPFEKLGQAQDIIEQVPRLAEYIVSRKMGRSIDVSMLDAGRVTTNFGASGDFTNMFNRNGVTFLSASVEGFNQQVRNIREAKAEGLEGWAKLAGKYAAAGLPILLLNHALWDDDEEYEELSDYVKQNYYIVGKFGDGKFLRIPKGRAVAVIQNAFEQMENLITGNDDVDLKTFGKLARTNLAPSDPLENNILSPIFQVKKNKTWYGEDLIPTRLQDVPAGEQFDETTDAISRWLGEVTSGWHIGDIQLEISPIKANYLFDQYGGIVSDIGLPMMTPKAESGDDNPLGKLIAPIRDAFTTDSVLKNQNVSDFYDKVDELTVNANASGATDEDALMSKYMNSINADLSTLYKQKREIQNSDLSNTEKYEEVREIQRQIDALAEEGLNTYQDISFEDDYREGGEYARIGDKVFTKNEEGEWSKLSDEQRTKYEVTKAAGDASYATDGKNHYRWYVPGEDAGEDAEEGWRKVTKDELKRQKEVTSGLDISPEEYWSNKEEYSYAYDYPENYAVARAVGGYESFKGYNEALYDIKADKDASGNSITGSRKEKVVDYLNNLDADYYTKIILFKNEYNADDTYNYEIIEYLNGREDISYQDMETILKKLGFEVDSNGNITW